MAGRDRAARLVGALLGAALAGGCASLTVMSHMPLSTMSRLSSLKLAEIDPAELRVAARLPDAIEPRSRGVKVRIEVAGMKHGKSLAMELAPIVLQKKPGGRTARFGVGGCAPKGDHS